MSSVAVVGARAATQYGQRTALSLAADVAGRGFAIVSGGAFGIDAAAHRGAMTTGVTVCVLASGIETAYPSAHRQLFEQVTGRGLIISEVPPHEPARRFRFLHRNRIIAALGRGTVVVEASLRSGSLGTARRARDLGRIVMAVPGPVTSHTSTGCHELLRTDPGTLLVTCAEDVIDAVGTLGVDAVDWRSGPAHPLDAVSDDARIVHDYLAAAATAGSVRLDSGLPAPKVAAALTELLAHGLVVRNGDRWSRA
jgi:DNA processing protein